ncbi:hypothetical protein Vadar_022293 [Vaccinium darrowii]|uniref:Uncharacterized protein n=1 Tax=Vaccinium darrowii TaxID=229202 RepID=A0ACB7ZCY0_9ERIC|nr:hypothetical protein Vadar_022293 [Vaccinium darrowii]
MKKKRYHISTTEIRSEPTNSVGASQSSDASQHPLSNGSSLLVQQHNSSQLPLTNQGCSERTHQQPSDYEMVRIENIQRNNIELRARGMPEIPIPSMNVVQHNPINENGKRRRDDSHAESHGASRPSQSRGASQTVQPEVPSHDLSPNSQPQLVEEDLDMGDELEDDTEVGIRDGSGKANKRGITRLSDIWNLPPGSRIVVKFNAALLPVGQEGSVFNRFIGTVARKPHLCPIHYNDWRKVPYHYKLDCWNIIESKFEFPEDERMRDKIKHDTLKSLGDKLRQWRCSLKSQHYDPSKTAAQIVAAAPATVNRDHYAELVDFWFSKEGKTLSDNNKKCRGENKVPHTAGSKTYSQHAYDLGEKTGVGVDRVEMYKLTHEKGGIPINDIASENIKKMEELRKSQESSSKEKPKGELVWSKDDIYSQVINKKEHYGSLRGMGFGYTSTNCGSPSNSGTRFKMTSYEERMQDKETIRDLQEKLEANNQQLEANNQQMNTMAGELNFLRAQVDFLLRHSGLQVQDGVSGARDQASPQTHQGSSFGSHEIEPRGNRII